MKKGGLQIIAILILGAFAGATLAWAQSGGLSPRCDLPSRPAGIQGVGAESVARLAGSFSLIHSKLRPAAPRVQEFFSGYDGNFLYHLTIKAGVLKLESRVPEIGKSELDEVLSAYEKIRKSGIKGFSAPEKSFLLNQKLLLLSMIGSEESSSTRAEQLALASKILGFDTVSVGAGDRVRFRDPVSGRIYFQDLSRIISLPPESAPLSSDIEARAASALKTTPVPSTLKWSSSSMKASAGYDGASSLVKLDISEKESLFGLEVEKRFGSGKRKSFLLSSQSQGIGGAEGETAIEALGDRVEGTPEAGSSLFTSILSGTGVTGYAKYDRLKGKIEFRTPSDDLGIYEVSGALEFKPFQLPIFADARRVFRNEPDSDGGMGDLETAHDRIGILFDGRGDTGKTYIVNRADIYLLDGFDAASAVGFRNALTAAFPMKTVGEFSVVLDLAKVMRNGSSTTDGVLPLDDIPVSATAKAQWKKSFSKLVEFGSEILYRKGADPDDIFHGSRNAQDLSRGEFAGALRLMVHY